MSHRIQGNQPRPVPRLRAGDPADSEAASRTGTPPAPADFDQSSFEPARLGGDKVEICSQRAELPVLHELGVPHDWLRTTHLDEDGRPQHLEVGIGSAGRGWWDPLGTEVISEADRGFTTGATCEEVPGVDRAAVDDELRARLGGTGVWAPLPTQVGPYGNCMTFVNDVLDSARSRPAEAAAPLDRRPATAPQEDGGMVYTVQAGDTLREIARRSGTSLDALCALNGIDDPDGIYAGDELRLPDGSRPWLTSQTTVEVEASAPPPDDPGPATSLDLPPDDAAASADDPATEE